MTTNKFKKLFDDCPGAWYGTSLDNGGSIVINPKYTAPAISYLKRHRVTITDTAIHQLGEGNPGLRIVFEDN